MQRLTPHCWLHPSSDLRVNSGLVETGPGVVIIDALMTAEDGETLAGHASDLGQTRFLVYTHHHPDHIGGSSAIEAGEVVASVGTLRMLETDLSRPVVPAPRMPSLAFGSDFVIRGETELRLSVWGGHSPGSTVVWVPEDRCLFTGDLVFRGRPPFLVAAEPDRWLAALDSLQGLDAEVIVPGHGDAGGPEVLREQRRWFDEFIPRARQIAEELPLAEAVVKVRQEFGYGEHQDWMLEIALRDRFGFIPG